MKLSPAVSRTLPFAIYMGFLAVGSALSFFQTHGVLPTFDERWLYPAKIALVMLSLFLLWKHFTELTKPGKTRATDWATAILVGIIVFVLWINLDQPWASMGHSAGYNPSDPVTHQPDWLLVSIRIFGAAIVVPIMEELFWRSFIMRWIAQHDFLSVDPARVGIKAFLFTAVLFASEHNLLLAGFVAGLAYNWLYMRTRNLWVPIVAHGITNGLLGLWVIHTQNWQFW